MSFNKQKISHFINKLYQALRSDISELVKQENEIRFINDKEIIEREKGDFSIEETNDNDVLKEVKIIDIPFKDDVFICILGKWDDSKNNYKLQLAGLNNTAKVVDGIIFYMPNPESKRLLVYLIELKTTLDDKKIEHCVEKFEQTISRLSLFIPTIAFANSINFETVKIEFKAIIFFSNRGSVKKEIKKSEEKNELPLIAQHLTEIYNAYHNKRTHDFGKGTVQIKKTLFTFDSEAEKIEMRFIGFCDRHENPIFEEETTANKIVIKFENMIF